jgi:hypothetical protein
MAHRHKNPQQIIIILKMLLTKTRTVNKNTLNRSTRRNTRWAGIGINTQSNAFLAVGAEFQWQQGKVVLVMIELPDRTQRALMQRTLTYSSIGEPICESHTRAGNARMEL